jgi:hypothetical protein
MSAGEITFRWLDGPLVSGEEWAREYARIYPILVARGWMALNKNMSRILIAEEADKGILDFIVIQMVPFVGPFFVHPSHRGEGGVAERLAKHMWEFLLAADARGWISIAESQHSVHLCERFGMREVSHPVYMAVRDGEVQ